MKILLTTDTVGGVWTYCVDIARSLAPFGVKIALATMGAPLSHDQREQLASLENVTSFESDYKLEWMDDPWRDVESAGQWLLAIEREFQPDVVHLNGYAHGCLPFSSPVLVVGHSCVLSWWEACRGEAAPAEWDPYSCRVRNGLQGADLVIAPTQAMMTALRRHYGPLYKTRVIPNGRSAALYRADCAKEPLILSAGRVWDAAKNVDALHAIAHQISWPIAIAGDNRHPAGGCAHAGGATLLGKLDERSLAHWYARAAIYALPARYEPFGLSVLEAALSGCALVLGDIPSLRENWEGAAEFVRADDPQQLRRSLSRLMEDSGYRLELVQHSMQRGRRLSLESFSKSYLLAYHELATLRQPSDRSTFACAL